MTSALEPETFRRLYGDFAEQNPMWNEIPGKTGVVYEWDRDSTYIQEPPFFENFELQPAPVHGDHRRPRAGDPRRLGHDRPHQPGRRDQGDSPAGRYPDRARRRAARVQLATAHAAATTAS